MHGIEQPLAKRRRTLEELYAKLRRSQKSGAKGYTHAGLYIPTIAMDECEKVQKRRSPSRDVCYRDFGRVEEKRGGDQKAASFPLPAYRTGRADFPHQMLLRTFARGFLAHRAPGTDFAAQG
jgi:hypothetical protein